LFYIDKKLYKIAITVEMPMEIGGSQGGNRGDDDDRGVTMGKTRITLTMWMI
jgi:hypothetical protein